MLGVWLTCCSACWAKYWRLISSRGIESPSWRAASLTCTGSPDEREREGYGGFLNGKKKKERMARQQTIFEVKDASLADVLELRACLAYFSLFVPHPSSRLPAEDRERTVARLPFSHFHISVSSIHFPNFPNFLSSCPGEQRKRGE